MPSLPEPGKDLILLDEQLKQNSPAFQEGRSPLSSMARTKVGATASGRGEEQKTHSLSLVPHQYTQSCAAPEAAGMCSPTKTGGGCGCHGDGEELLRNHHSRGPGIEGQLETEDI